MRAIRTAARGMVSIAILSAGAWLAWPGGAAAHCDTLDGPVVMDARAALAEGDPAPILKWVRPEDEAEARAAFESALAVRSLNADAMRVADTYLFETVVRLHRASEGEPFTGLKPAGEVDPVVATTDRVIASGDVTGMAGEIGRAVEGTVRDRFTRLMEAQRHRDESVETGRAYVAAYVGFVHFIEGLHAMVVGGEEGSGTGGEEGHHSGEEEGR